MVTTLKYTILLVGVLAFSQASRPETADTVDDPTLPRVLLIGDSISIGYTLPTRDLLNGVANLHRIPVNGGNSSKGRLLLGEWLGQKDWDVVHLNFGLHDIVLKDGRRAIPIEQYEENLEQIVTEIEKRTGATIIWATTTPVPTDVDPPRVNADVERYNSAALTVMTRHQVFVDDLYGAAVTHPEGQIPHDVHFTSAGYRHLAESVAVSIRAALKMRKPSPDHAVS